MSTETNQKRGRKQNTDQQMERRWENIRNQYRDRYPELNEDDVNYREGEFDTMTDRIAKRTNRSREQVQNEIRDWNNEYLDDDFTSE